MSLDVDNLINEIEERKEDTTKAILGNYNKKDLEENDILHQLCRNGWLGLTRELIERKGLNPRELIDSRHGANLLHFACTSGNIELVKYLIIECHCDHLRISDDDLSTLHCAVMGGLPIVRYLMGLSGS